MVPITTIEDIQKIGNDPGYPSSETYVLQNDIDASGTITWNGGTGFVPLPNFTGEFDGNNFTISDIVIKPASGSEHGLFSIVTTALIKDLSIVNAQIGNNESAILLGKGYGTTEINNCTVSGTINGGGAGIAVKIYDSVSIIDCNSTIEINSGRCGGLVMVCYGSNNNISGCNVNLLSSNISSTFGGLTEWFEDGSIDNCDVNLNITTANTSFGNCGGFIGNLNGDVSIDSCNVSGIVSVNGSMNTWGSFVAYTQSFYTITIDNCTADVVMSFDIGSYNYIGGFVGYINGGLLTNCISSGSINIDVGQAQNIGGFAGYIGQNVEGCSTSVDIIINVNVQVNNCGGFVAYHGNGDITLCSSTGDISVLPFGYALGGFVGYSSSSDLISQCFSTGNVICDVNHPGNQNLGGFVGYCFSDLTNCYSQGNVAGGNYVGGFGGRLNGDNENCYSSGSVSGYSNVGGFVGLTYGTFTSCYWDTDTSGLLVSAGGTGKTTIEMKTQSTFIGWNFVDIWKIIETIEYPTFVPLAIPIEVIGISSQEYISTPSLKVYGKGNFTIILGKILMTFAVEMERFQDRVRALIREAVPGLSSELLPEWEQDVGLPDECSPLAQNIEERAQVVHAKFTGNYYGQSKQFFIDYANSLGATIRIKEYSGIGSSFRVNVNRVDRMPGIESPTERIFGSRLWSSGSVYKWIIYIDDVFGNVTEDQIKCRIRQVVPAHTELIFS
jgi:uncharacterized protein YmfQ (DUF2313 family)